MRILKPNRYIVKYFLISILIFFSFFGVGTAFLTYLCERNVESNLEKTTRITQSMWNSVTVANVETMQAYMKHFIVDDQVIEILKMANSKDEESKKLARLKLFKHLWYRYAYLKENVYVRQLHFILPDNRSFLRFHLPNKYDDDLSFYRRAIVIVNQTKKPFFGFEIGRYLAGYRYIFPIFDKDGSYLGCVELSRAFEIIRKNLNEVNSDIGYTIFLRKSDIDVKILTEYKEFYMEVPDLGGWVIEDPYRKLPDSPKPLSPEYQKVLEFASKKKEFKELVNSKINHSIYVEKNSNYYKITALKIYEANKDYHSAVLIAIHPAPDIKAIKNSFREYKVVYGVLLAIISIYTFLYLLSTYRIRVKSREMEVITSTMGSGLFVLNQDGSVNYVNDTALKILGYSKEEFLNTNLHDLVHSHTGPKEECPISKSVKSKVVYHGDDTFRRKDGKLVDVSVDVRPIVVDDKIVGSVMVFNDITERKEMEKRLFDMATKDSLTKLYNRRYQIEALKRAKDRSDRYKTPFSVVMLDIDNFKSINDTFGHDMGDRVLVAIANVIKDEVRSTDIPARWGGEEFLILLTDTDIEGAVMFGERIKEAVSKLRIESIGKITVSVGVAQYKEGESIDSLIIRADTGLYQAKRSGKNKVVRVDI